MSEWKSFCLGDVCDTISETYRRKSERVTLINTSDVLNGKILNHDSVPNKNLKGQFKKTFQRDDILFSEIRPINRRCAFVDFDDTQDYIASTKLMVLRANKQKILPRYLYFFLTAENILRELQHLAETRSGTFPQITFDSELAPFPIKLPPLETQKKIAAVLGALDDKIELNNAINKNLEEQAQAIYKDMFVDNFNPAWRSGTLSDIAEIKSGKRPLDRFEKESEVAFVPIFGASSIMGYTTSVLSNKKILITGRVGTHGIIQRYNKPCWVSDNAFIITSNYYEYIFQILHSINYNNLNRGSTQPLLTQKDLKKFIIIIPDEKILTKFEDVVGYLMSMHDENIEQNRKLGEIRDALLPRLMSGEIDVSKVEQ